MNVIDRRSYIFGLLIAARLAADSGGVRAKAEENLRRLRAVHTDGSANDLLDEWERLLAATDEEIIDVLSSTSAKSIELRHASPFAGVLTVAEREKVLEDTRGVQ